MTALEPCTLVIFGGAGDLATRKLIPALYHLQIQGALPEPFAVVSVARSVLSDAAYLDLIHKGLETHSRTHPIDDEQWQALASKIHYVSIGTPDGFSELAHYLESLDSQLHLGGRRIFFMSTPPDAYLKIIEAITQYGLNKPQQGWSRLVVEKPFGHNLESSTQLLAAIDQSFSESSVFRSDHFLSKTSAANILAARAGSIALEGLLNRNFVDRIEITVAEDIGIEGRGKSYEQVGALRDIIQNHALQLMALSLMELPSTFEADSIRDEKVKILKALKHLTPETVATQVVRGQYTSGFVDGVRVPGYRDEVDVAKDSNTETYASLLTSVQTWRWDGVNIAIRTGKRLPKRVSEIVFHFRPVPHLIFSKEKTGLPGPGLLMFHIQPDEGVTLRINAKAPVAGYRVRPVDLSFKYATTFAVNVPDAYESVLSDVLRGDGTAFCRRDELEAQWQFVAPILDTWAGDNEGPALYTAGSWGPTEAEFLMARLGNAWRKP